MDQISTQKKQPLLIAGKNVVVSGKLPRLAQLRSEYDHVLAEPEKFLDQLKEAGIPADIFTFVENLSEHGPDRSYPMELDEKAVLRITQYEHWWKHRINDKTRNMIRKASKKGVTVGLAAFNESFVRGIQEIYNESPLRQGRPFPHYGKDLKTVERENSTFLDRSDIISAVLDGELIGFAKLVHVEGYSVLMKIISKNSHRDKAPSNALLGKAVEICAEKRVPFLIYGKWSLRGLGEFKKHHGFECMKVRRYFVPLNTWGQIALKLQLHRSWLEAGRQAIPPDFARRLVELRSRLYSVWFRGPNRSLR